MMKEIFVYIVGMKLKKHHKRIAIVFTDNFRIGDR
jgi:flagellar biosynthesis GTPase FlhF